MAKPFKNNMNEVFNQSQQRKEQAANIALKRKEEFLGARVPKELRNRVIDRANHLGIPVSILIRNILEEAFSENRTGSHMKSSNDVLGWEEIIVNQNVRCLDCGTDLLKGQNAHYGVGSSHQIVLCRPCLNRRL